MSTTPASMSPRRRAARRSWMRLAKCRPIRRLLCAAAVFRMAKRSRYLRRLRRIQTLMKFKKAKSARPRRAKMGALSCRILWPRRIVHRMAAPLSWLEVRLAASPHLWEERALVSRQVHPPRRRQRPRRRCPINRRFHHRRLCRAARPI